MKVLPVLLLLFAATAFIRAQNPGLLNPSEAACAEAERLGAKAFKLLPRGMFKDPKDSSKDEDNPLGVRGGGAFYSFSTGSHSYNKIPQISLEKDSSLLAGYFYGYNYSLVMDMGRVPLDAVSLEDSKIFFLSNYKSPGPISEIQSEHERLSDISRANGFMFMTWLPTTVGRTYVFRVISFDEADLLVAFQILPIPVLSRCP